MIENFIESLPYVGVVAVLLASGFGLPIPEDVPLLLGGYLCGIGKADITLMVPICFVAVVGADFIVFLLGRKYGHHVPRMPILRRYLTESRLARAEQAFHAHGGKALFMARFMPGLRAPMYFSAGVFKIPAWKMLTFDGTAAILSVPLWVLLAWWFAQDIEKVRVWSTGAQAVLLALVLVAGGAYLAMKWGRQRRVASAG